MQVTRAFIGVRAARQQVLSRLKSDDDAATGRAALALRTSMRNQWPCSVLKVESIGGQIRVWLRAASDAGSDWTIAARITPESYELLGLAPGVQVLALCKATAVKVWPGQERPADQDGLAGSSSPNTPATTH